MSIDEKGIWVIGDVHGEYEKLLYLLEKIPKNESVCFVGDLIDRGKHSAKVVQLIKENNYLCVKGNHELMLVESLLSRDFSTWKQNGGNKTIKSYFREKKRYNSDFHFLKNLPYFLYFEIEGYKPLVVSHSYIFNTWVDKDFSYSEKELEDMTWLHIINENHRNFIKEDNLNIFNIFGHTIVKDVIITDSYAMIDTGACYKKEDGYGKLTAFHYPSLGIVSVE